MKVTRQQMYDALPQIRDTAIDPETRFRHSVVIPFATYSPWLEDPDFQSVYGSLRGSTLVDVYRAFSLWSLLAQTRAIDGDILEVGVWRGGTGCMMAARARMLAFGARVFLCDTFTGVAKAGPRDSVYRGGEHNDASAATVRALATRLMLDNIDILEGLFPDQTASTIADRRFRFCHIDVDVYESAKQTLDWVWPRLLPGGIVVFDDYGFINCDGVTQIVNERADNSDSVTLHNLSGQAVMIKLR